MENYCKAQRAQQGASWPRNILDKLLPDHAG